MIWIGLSLIRLVDAFRISNFSITVLFSIFLVVGCIPEVKDRIPLGDNWQYALDDGAKCIESPETLDFKNINNLNSLAILHPEKAGFLCLKNTFQISKKTKAKLGLYLGRITFADRTYLNGEFIGETGEFPPYPKNSFNIARLYPVSWSDLKEGENQFIIQIYFNNVGSMHDIPILGNRSDLEALAKIRFLFDVFVNSVVAILSLFAALTFIIIFLNRIKEKFYLYFSSALVFFTLFTLNQFIWWLPIPALDGLWIGKIQFISLFSFLWMIGFFLRDFLELKRLKNSYRILNTALVLTISSILFIPWDFTKIISVINYCMLSVPIIFFIFIYWIIKAILDKKPYINSLLVSMSFAALIAFYDVIVMLLNLPPLFLSAIAIPVFLGGVTLILVNRFVSVYNEVENMTAKLDELNKDLAHKNDELVQLDKMKDDFMANTSHELRTPLNGIIGIAESLIDGATGKLSKETNKNLSLISVSGKRLSHLINDILDFSKLKHKDLKVELKPVDLYSLTNLVLELSEPFTRTKNLQIKNKIPENIPAVFADENRLQQIMHNLIGNAIKFTEEGEIQINAAVGKFSALEKIADLDLQADESDRIAITVSDTGIGIPKEKLEFIFEAFEQVDNSNTRNYGGTGLGLSITKQLVELQNGNIYVESELGKGSKFILTLPITKEKPEIQIKDRIIEINPTFNEIEKEIVKVNINSVKGHILVVDDEPINCQVISNHFTLRGYEVITASSGEEALEILKMKANIDIVLLDVMMPKMTGLEVCEKIRETYESNRLPVIFLTAKNNSSDILEGFNVKGNDYIVKPFSKDELLSRVGTHIELKDKTQRLIEFNQNLEKKVAERTEELKEAHKKILLLEKENTEKQMAGGFAHEMRNALVGSKLVIQHTLGLNHDTPVSVNLENNRKLKEIYLYLQQDLPEEKLKIIMNEMKVIFNNEEQLEKNLNMIYRSISRGLMITQQIMDYSKIGHEVVRKDPINIDTILQQIAEENNTALGEFEIKTQLHLDCANAVMYGLESHFESIFKNLIFNARDALLDNAVQDGRNKNISISSRIENNTIFVEVTDNGVGIHPENISKIYNAFFSTKPETGTGLGLSTVQKIVSLYNGTIDVKSVINKGTTFVVSFPSSQVSSLS